MLWVWKRGPVALGSPGAGDMVWKGQGCYRRPYSVYLPVRGLLRLTQPLTHFVFPVQRCSPGAAPSCLPVSVLAGSPPGTWEPGSPKLLCREKQGLGLGHIHYPLTGWPCKSPYLWEPQFPPPLMGNWLTSWAGPRVWWDPHISIRLMCVH